MIERKAYQRDQRRKGRKEAVHGFYGRAQIILALLPEHVVHNNNPYQAPTQQMDYT
jgi:hypothetical protein